MAYIEERNGKYRACIRKGGHSKSRTFARKKDALAWARAEEYKIDDGRAAIYSSVTVDELIDFYIKNVLPDKKSERRERIMLQLFKRLFPMLCLKKAADFGRAEVVLWREARLKQVSPASVNREWNVLSHLFTHAKRNRGLNLPDNPFHHVARPPQSEARHRRITPEDVQHLQKIAQYQSDKEPINGKQWALWAFLFALETACRLGEICKLQDFDIEEDLIHLRDTKNGDDRYVPLSAEAKRLLSLVTLPVPHSSDYLSQKFSGLARDLDDLRFHDSRHEALSRMAKKINNPMTLAKISGHKDLKILLNVYYNPNGNDLKGLL